MSSYLAYGVRRTARAMAIGSTIAVGLYGVATLAYGTEPVHEGTKVPPEWSRKTREFLREAEDARTTAQKAAAYAHAVESLTLRPDGSTVDLHRQGESWLTAYADVLRRLGLAMAESQSYSDEEAAQPLTAAATIPFGNPALRRQAAAVLWRLTGDEDELCQALDLPRNSLKKARYSDIKVPQELSPAEAAPLVELAKFWVSKQNFTDALNVAVAVHRALPPANDTRCTRASVAGLIGQMLWKMQYPDEARRWLAESRSSAAAAGRSPACVQCAALAQELLDRTS